MHRRWNIRNIEALSGLREELMPENRYIYDESFRFWNALLWSRPASLYRTGFIGRFSKGISLVVSSAVQAALAWTIIKQSSSISRITSPFQSSKIR